MTKRKHWDIKFSLTKTLTGVMLWLLLLALWFWFLTTHAEQHIWLENASGSLAGASVFVVIGILTMVLLLPGLFVTVTAGFLFGLVKGVLLVIFAETLGATLAFVLGRRVLKQPLLKYLDGHHPLLFDLDERLRNKGGMIVFLTRLIPMFPFKLSNYYFGAANYRMRGFVIGTALGIIPITILNVMLGVAMARVGGTELDVTKPWWMLLISGISLALLIALISRQAWRSLVLIRAQNRPTTKLDSNTPDLNGEEAGHA